MKLDTAKPWLLFCGANYYPLGGLGDFVDSFASLNEALASLTREPDISGSWAEIANWQTGEAYAYSRKYTSPWRGHGLPDPQSPPPRQDTAQGAILPHSGS